MISPSGPADHRAEKHVFRASSATEARGQGGDLKQDCRPDPTDSKGQRGGDPAPGHERQPEGGRRVGTLPAPGSSPGPGSCAQPSSAPYRRGGPSLAPEVAAERLLLHAESLVRENPVKRHSKLTPRRFRHLREGRVVHVTDLFSKRELKTSTVYKRRHAQGALSERPEGSTGGAGSVAYPLDRRRSDRRKRLVVRPARPHRASPSASLPVRAGPSRAGRSRRVPGVVRRAARQHARWNHPAGPARADCGGERACS